MIRTYAPPSLYVAPTLIIGLGGTGVSVIRLLKRRIRQSMQPLPGIIEFLAVDTEPVQNLPGDERIFDREIAYLGDYNATSVLSNPDKHPHIDDWWFRDSTITGSIFKGARQRRSVGRLSLYTRWGQFAQRLDPKLRKIREIAEKERIERRGIDVERTGQVRVYIVSSLCGGTGSGTFLDTAFRVRKEMKDDAEITGIFVMPSVFLPDVQSRIQRQRIQGNAYAALLELNHFLSGATFESCFPDHAFHNGNKQKNVFKLHRPFDMVYLVDRSNGREGIGSIDDVRQMTAQYIFLDVITPIGKRLSGLRENLQDLASERRKSAQNGPSNTLAIAGFATASLVMPANLTETISHMYGADLLRRRMLGLLNAEHLQTMKEELANLSSRITQVLRFETTGSRQPAASVPSLFGPPVGGAATPSIDAEKRAHAARQIIQEVHKQLESTFQRRGLIGALWAAEELQRILIADQEAAEKMILEIETEISRLRSLTLELPATNIFQRLVDLTFGRREYARRLADLKANREKTLAELQRRSDLNKTILSIVTGIRDSVVDVRRHIEDAHKRCEVWVKEFDHGSSTLQSAKGARESDAMLFELVTELGNEEEILPPGQPQHERTPLARYLEHRYKQNNDLGNDEDLLCSTLTMMGIFNLTLSETPDGLALHWAGGKGSDSELFGKVFSTIDRHVRQQVGQRTPPGVVDYLRWFYANIAYYNGTGTASRNSPIDPVRQLRQRCYAPFLQIDEGKLGTEHAFDTEPVTLLGISPLRDKLQADQADSDDVFAEFDGYMDVDTGVPDRLDILFGKFGYKVDDLRTLEEFHLSYRYFMENLGESLHIHRDWPFVVGMVDLMPKELVPSHIARRNGVAPDDQAAPTDAPAAPPNGEVTAPPVVEPNPGATAHTPATGQPEAAPIIQIGTSDASTLWQLFDAQTASGLVRDRNEDFVFANLLAPLSGATAPRWGIYIAADGVGGSKDGHMASRKAALEVHRVVAQRHAEMQPLKCDLSIESLQALLCESFESANRIIQEERRQRRSTMETTLVAALVQGPTAIIANVGDSRTYLYRKGQMQRITEDHSKVFTLFRQGMIREEEIYTHPENNLILRSVGSKPQVKVDLFVQALLPDDWIILATDGLWELVRDPQIAAILGQSLSPEQATQRLIAAANKAGGKDNIGVVAVHLIDR